MKKNLLLLAILICTVLSTYAQDDTSPKVSAGFSLGATIGPRASTYPVTGGIAFKFEYPVSDMPLSITLAAGYTFFVSGNGYYVDYSTDYGSYSSGSIASFVPVTIGAKYFVAGKLFVAGDVGVSFYLNSSSAEYNAKKIAPIVAPSAGYRINLGSSNYSVDVGLGFEQSLESGGFGQVAIHAAFNLGL